MTPALSIPKNIATTRPLIDPQAGFRGRQDETSSSWKEVFFWSTIFEGFQTNTGFQTDVFFQCSQFLFIMLNMYFPFFSKLFFILRGFLCPLNQPSQVFCFLVFRLLPRHLTWWFQESMSICMFFGLKKWLALLSHEYDGSGNSSTIWAHGTLTQLLLLTSP